MKKPVTIDFETMGIEGRPAYPPVPVGVAIKYPGKKGIYFAWGHPTENTCSWGEARTALEAAWAWPGGLLFQNMKFDLDVAEVHLGLPLPAWDKIEDTMFLLFLDSPHEQELGLKPSSERLLGLKPEEQDAVGQWLVDNQPIPGIRISLSKQSDHYFGKYIAYAPGGLVGKYCVGDAVRTEKLFNLLRPKTEARGMSAAYDRERRLMPVLLAMERQGVPVDLKRLRADVASYTSWVTRIDAWLISRLKAEVAINLDSGEALVAALVASGKVDLAKMPRTATGKVSTAKDSLLLGVTDRTLLAALTYRTQLSTCLRTFMRPWLLTAERSGGLIFTSWNQIKGVGGGTRTGRLSSHPNFQNIPNEFQPWGKARCPFKDLPPLPRVRSYLVPFKGEVLIDRDYSQQELRILAHFDGGHLTQKYLTDPWIDFHDYTKLELEKMGKFYERKPVKNTNFGLLYGMGVGKLAEKNNMPVDEASALKKAILLLYPGLKQMYRDMKVRAMANEPIRTWGGREYYCEEPRVVKGRIQEYDYKLVNVLIQGSAADCTKEALIRFADAKRPAWRILLNVHDQLTVSVPRKNVKEAMEALRVAMEGVEFDVPMLSEGATSVTNWDELKDYDKKGVLV